VFVATWGLAWGTREIRFSAADGRLPSLYAADADRPGVLQFITRVPGRLQFADVSADGTMLVVRDEAQRRVNAMSGGDAAEHDLSWFDWTQARDLSSDGQLLLFHESGAALEGHFGAFVRPTDGSAAQRVGDGTALALSPDKKTVLVTQSDRLVRLPVGPGQPSEVAFPPAIRQVPLAEFMADGKRAVIEASELHRPNRLYVTDFNKEWRAFTPEGVRGSFALAPDGSAAVARIGEAVYLFRTDGSGQSAVPGLRADDTIVGWTDRAREVWVKPAGALWIDSLDIITGTRRQRRVLGTPSDIQPVDLRVTPDGTSYVYNYLDAGSTLYLARGLR
jgi:hypothetical protein